MSTFIANRLIAALSPEAQDILVSRATAVTLQSKTSLYQGGVLPEYAYFITSGLVSIVTMFPSGGSAEVGIVGAEGLVGGLHIFGPGTISTNCFVQLEGSALRLPLAELTIAFRSSEEIRDLILEFQQEQATVVSQIAGCNRHHIAEQRLARLLLMAGDCARSESLNLTQDSLSMMLGSRRTTVTCAAGVLQRAKLIDYSRGKIQIVNRKGLETAACGCYAITRNALANLYRSASPSVIGRTP